MQALMFVGRGGACLEQKSAKDQNHVFKLVEDLHHPLNASVKAHNSCIEQEHLLKENSWRENTQEMHRTNNLESARQLRPRSIEVLRDFGCLDLLGLGSTVPSSLKGSQHQDASKHDPFQKERVEGTATFSLAKIHVCCLDLAVLASQCTSRACHSRNMCKNKGARMPQVPSFCYPRSSGPYAATNQHELQK